MTAGGALSATDASDRRNSARMRAESSRSEKGFVTYVVQQDKAQIRPVAIGLRTGTGVVEILSGVEAGELVVTEGSDRLADGVPVQVAPGAAAPAPSAKGEAP